MKAYDSADRYHRHPEYLQRQPAKIVTLEVFDNIVAGCRLWDGDPRIAMASNGEVLQYPGVIETGAAKIEI